MLGLHCRTDFSLVAVPGLLRAGASLALEHGPQGVRASVVGATGSRVQARELCRTGSRSHRLHRLQLWALEQSLNSCGARA